MILHIDTDKMEELGLTDREMWLYLTLTILSARRPWKGTDDELAAKCKNNMSRVTTMRLKKSLIEKGLILENEAGLSSVQNEHDSVQNEHDSVQNEQNSKEKEKNQKKIEKMILHCSSLAKDIKSQPPQQPVFVSVFIPPTWDELVRFATEKNIPQSLYTQFFAYYTANGWTLKRGAKMENWKAVLTYWFEKEKKDAAKTIYQGVYGKATEQEQAAYAGSQYAEYQARKQREQQEEAARQANTETRYCTYEEYRQVAGGG